MNFLPEQVKLKVNLSSDKCWKKILMLSPEWIGYLNWSLISYMVNLLSPFSMGCSVHVGNGWHHFGVWPERYTSQHTYWIQKYVTDYMLKKNSCIPANLSQQPTCSPKLEWSYTKAVVQQKLQNGSQNSYLTMEWYS